MKRVCVFCGSASGARPVYADGARQLGETLARRNRGLVYGGAKVGLMGIVSDAVLAAGGNVIGVIPGFLAGKEIAHEKLSELHVVETMHERKALMADRSDAFVALPGGLGTLDELFEILTWAQLGLHHKPCILFNIQGYFDSLIAFLAHAEQEGLVRPEHRRALLIASSPDEVLDYAG